MENKYMTRPVLITTKYQGVFFGYIKQHDEPTGEKNKLVVNNCRNCLHWPTSIHGFLGLSTKGPNSECRISPACKQLTLYGVTSVAECTPEAVKNWESEPWHELSKNT